MLFNWIKNTAGRERYVLTIVGSIIVLFVAWVLGIIFMPKNNAEKRNEKLEAVWYSTTDSGFKRLEIKRSGYFYFDDVQKNRKSFNYKGVITETIKDTFTLIAFYNDTILYHKIVMLNKKNFKLTSIKDSTILNFVKEK